MRTIVLPNLCLCLVLATLACGPKAVRPVSVAVAPRFAEFVAPVVPSALAGTAAADGEGRAWALLQAGDVKSAERLLSETIKASPDFFPAETALGYVALTRKDPAAALAHFDRTLKVQQADPSALVGSGLSHLAAGREAEALAAFKAAVAADPSLTEVRRRAEVLQFRGLEQELTAARTASRDRHYEEAIRRYSTAIASSPDSPFLYRELAGVERQAGDLTSAIKHLRNALALDANDPGLLAQLGDFLDAQGDLDGAMKAYAAALAIEPGAELDAKLDAVRARADLARLPPEYRAIEGLTQMTRGDLAALIGVRLAPLLVSDPRRDGPLLTDARTHWAAPWIVMVVRAGVMEPFANHAFQPRQGVRRADLAQAVSRLLTRVAAQKPARANGWQGARLKFSDLAPGHLAYAAASAAVAAGVLTLEPGGRFQPARPVAGAEAIQAVDRVAGLADVPAPARAAQ